jgi:2-methylisocitrate lyase-like PEP mutase family enzyme
VSAPHDPACVCGPCLAVKVERVRAKLRAGAEALVAEAAGDPRKLERMRRAIDRARRRTLSGSG